MTHKQMFTLATLLLLSVACTTPKEKEPEAPEIIAQPIPASPGRHLHVWGDQHGFYGIANNSHTAEEWLVYQVTAYFCEPWNKGTLAEDSRRSGNGVYRLVVADWFATGAGNEMFTGMLQRKRGKQAIDLRPDCHLTVRAIEPQPLKRAPLLEKFFVFGDQNAGYAVKYNGSQLSIHRILVPWSEAKIVERLPEGMWFDPEQLARHDLLVGSFSFPRADPSKAPKPHATKPSAPLKLGEVVYTSSF